MGQACEHGCGVCDVVYAMDVYKLDLQHESFEMHKPKERQERYKVQSNTTERTKESKDQKTIEQDGGGDVSSSQRRF